MNILIIGAPGTGKGTMSNLIVDKYHVVHISTGDMLRHAVALKTEVGLKAQEYMEAGKLVPDEIIHGVILERLKEDDIKDGFLMDGYPRNIRQAEDLEGILKDLGMHIDVVLDLNVDEEVLKERITGRRVCKNCGAIYHIKNNPPQKENTCDLCGGELYTRKDDTLESLVTRLAEYHQNTKPLIDHYQKQGLVKEIDASLKVEEVFKAVSETIEKVKA